MSFTNCGSRVLVLLVGVLLLAVPVCAQTPSTQKPSHPYRTLFGSDDSRIPSLHALDLDVSLDGGLDDGVFASTATPVEGTDPQAAGFQGLYAAAADLAYKRRGRHVVAALLSSTSLPYYSMFPDQPLTLAYGANGNVSLLSSRTTATASGSFMHSPYYATALDPSSGPVIGGGGYTGRASALNPNNVASAGAAFTYRLDRRTSMILAYAYDSTAFTEQARSNNNQGVSGSLQRQLSRGMTVTGGYAYRTADYTTDELLTSSSSQDVDVGFGYTHQAPRGRSTSLRVGAGVSNVDEYNRQYQGWRWTVHFDHAVSSRWNFGADYGRNLHYYSTIQQPVWTDDVRASAAGYVNARLQLILDVNYSNGQRVSGGGPGYDTYWATVRLQWALTQWLAVTGAYIYYRYDYPPDYSLPAGMPHQLNRQRVQFGARFWLPLARWGRSGPPNAQAN